MLLIWNTSLYTFSVLYIENQFPNLKQISGWQNIQGITKCVWSTYSLLVIHVYTHIQRMVICSCFISIYLNRNLSNFPSRKYNVPLSTSYIWRQRSLIYTDNIYAIKRHQARLPIIYLMYLFLINYQITIQQHAVLFLVCNTDQGA